jgi:hypothetical protein
MSLGNLISFNRKSSNSIEVDWMTTKINSCKYLPLGLKLLFGCFLLFVLGSMTVGAQADKYSCMNADLKGYAELAFCLPPEVNVNPESLAEANYTEGRDVQASLLFNESRVYVHLVYPCQALKGELAAADLRSALESFDPALMNASYSPNPLNISGKNALWGQDENRIFVAYQPSEKTFAVIFMDESLSETAMESFLGSLQINVNEGSTPLTPGYCGEPTAVPAVAIPAKVVPETVPSVSDQKPLQGPGAEARMSRLESSQEKMATDMEAAQERLAAMKERLDGGSNANWPPKFVVN